MVGPAPAGAGAFTDKKIGFNVAYLLFALLAFMALREVSTQAQAVEKVPCSSVEQHLRQGKATASRQLERVRSDMNGSTTQRIAFIDIGAGRTR